MNEITLPKKKSYSQQARELLQAMKDRGVTKFISYDLLPKNCSQRHIDGIRCAVFDLSASGEIATVKDNDGKPKKVRPHPDQYPRAVESKVMINQYEFKNWGNPDKKKVLAQAKGYRDKKKAKLTEVVKISSVWEEIWPELYTVPKFKSQREGANNALGL